MARLFGSIALGAISCATTMKVPKLWDEKTLADWATPVAGLGVAPGFVNEKEYYAAPVDNLRTYPVYHPDREPAGYRDWLRSQGPKPLIEPAKLATKSDWIEAGRPRAGIEDSQGNRLLQGPVATRTLVSRAVRALGLGPVPRGLVRPEEAP